MKQLLVVAMTFMSSAAIAQRGPTDSALLEHLAGKWVIQNRWRTMRALLSSLQVFISCLSNRSLKKCPAILRGISINPKSEFPTYRAGYSAGIGTGTRLSIGMNSRSPDPV